MVEVNFTDEFEEWFDDLNEEKQDRVVTTVRILEQEGVRLGFPLSSAIHGTKFPLRELRILAMGRLLRVFYAFDVNREAALLTGGDKTGDDRFYERMVPIAERIWKEYCREIASLE